MTCGQETFEAYDTLLNPVLIIEVLSPTTGDYDRGGKFQAYRSISSLNEYWTVAQDRPLVEQWKILQGHWTLTEHSALEGLIGHGDAEVPLMEIYRDVNSVEL